MPLYMSNCSNYHALPLIGLTFRRWEDSEYMYELPGYHLTISWNRVKWYGGQTSGDDSTWIKTGKAMVYRNSITFEFNWPRITWRA
jgi:hypothetical protein